MLAEPQVEAFYPDLADERVTSALAVVHSRFSTNTFPAWPLAHPYRYVAHNGEINTLRGNRNWMAAREALLESDLIPGDLARLSPIVTPDASDSATFDEVLELLHLGGRSLPHAVLMMIPEAWENHDEMDPARRAFYEFHSTLMEPWDGPALVAFTDGTLIGAVLDRNGLRPARYWVTEDGTVVLASEVGVLDVEPSAVVRKGRLEPGRMFLVDTAAGRIVDDAEIKGALAAEHPYADWLHAGLIQLDDLPEREREVPAHAALTHRQQSFGYTEEELSVLLKPMAATGAEPIGSMGNDAPLAAVLGAAAAAVRLLHPAVRAGHQPAAGRDPGGAGHLAAEPARPGAEPARRRPGQLPHDRACRSRCWATTTSPRSSTSTTTASYPGFASYTVRGRVPGRRGRRGPAQAARRDPRRGLRRPSRTAPG